MAFSYLNFTRSGTNFTRSVPALHEPRLVCGYGWSKTRFYSVLDDFFMVGRQWILSLRHGILCVCVLVILSLLPQRHNRAVSMAHAHTHVRAPSAKPLQINTPLPHQCQTLFRLNSEWDLLLTNLSFKNHLHLTHIPPMHGQKTLTLIYPTIYTVVLTISHSAGCHVPQKVSHQSASAVNTLYQTANEKAAHSAKILRFMISISS